MPYIDLNVEYNVFKNQEFSHTIIGAGAAGIMLAVKLSEFGCKVLLVESGHFEIDEERQKLNEVVQTGKFLNNAIWGRKRAIGGTTLAWGGQSLPFSPLDFEKRSWIENSGWPLQYKELEPYYSDANKFMKIDLLDYKDEILKKIHLKDPGFDKNVISYHVSKWANEPNFKELYNDTLKRDVTVVYNTVLTGINTNNINSITSVDVFNFNKKKFTVPVKNLILAVGGIETNRILLNNSHLFKTANNIDLLGKGFMDHPCIEVGEIAPKRSFHLQRYFNTHIYKNKKYSLRLSLADNFQKVQKTLNCSGSIVFKLPDESFDPYAEIKQFRKDYKVTRLLKMRHALPSISISAFALLYYKFLYKLKATPKVLLMIEQEPLTSSEITLSQEKDEFGEYKANINWTISRLTWDTAVKSSHAIKGELERLDFGSVRIYPDVNTGKDNWADLLSDVNHHMGGCRMSANSSEGIVNTNLQIWGINNLFVCSSAVFPTSSHSNPTLTLLAFAARLTDHLTMKIKQV